jgi:DNA invertase Pin-like site-specific DNA recombinase
VRAIFGVSAMDMRIALYLRASTSEQTIETQGRELEAVAARHGWNVVATFTDEGLTRTKGRDKRPGLRQLCEGIARHEFDRVAAWSVCRLGRSLQDLVGFLGELQANGVDLYLHQPSIDTSTPAGKAIFETMGMFAEFERAIIVERVKAAQARARGQGKKLGRPSAMTPAKERQARRLLAKNVGILKVAKKLGLGTGTVQKIKAEMEHAA